MKKLLTYMSSFLCIVAPSALAITTTDARNFLIDKSVSNFPFIFERGIMGGGTAGAWEYNNGFGLLLGYEFNSNSTFVEAWGAHPGSAQPLNGSMWLTLASDSSADAEAGDVLATMYVDQFSGGLFESDGYMQFAISSEELATGEITFYMPEYPYEWEEFGGGNAQLRDASIFPYVCVECGWEVNINLAYIQTSAAGFSSASTVVSNQLGSQQVLEVVGHAWADEGDQYTTGHVGEVPIPAAFWLFSSALMGIFTLRKANKSITKQGSLR